MKWINSRQLFNINQELASLFSTENRLFSRVESYSLEKKQKLIPNRPVSSPVTAFAGVNLIEQSNSPSGKQFEYIIGCLSSAFPDFDFGAMVPEHFKRVISPDQIRSSVSWSMASAVTSSDVVETHLWQAIETEISPVLCDIFQYEPNCEDIFSEMGALWNYTYFFINEKQRKVLLFHLREGAQAFESDSDGEDSISQDESLLEQRYGFGVF